MRDDCQQTCDSAYDELSGADADAVDSYVECMDGDLGGTCTGDTFANAMSGDCASERWQPGVGDWTTAISDGWTDRTLLCTGCLN